MQKVLIALKDMNIGGVEKSLLSLLDTINQSEYEVDLLLLEKKGGFLDSIPKWVNIIICDEYANIKEEVNQPPMMVLKKHIKQGNVLRTIRLGIAYFMTTLTEDYSYYYKEIFKEIPKIQKKYDIAISYTSIINYLTWYVRFHVEAQKYIGWIHFDVSKLEFNRKLFLKLHKDMEKIYVVSEDAKGSFIKKFPELETKAQLKYNLIDRKKIISLSQENVEILRKEGEPIIVTLGRLTEEKGQDIVPEIAQQLKRRGLKFTWYLIGDGNLRTKIEENKKKFNVTDCVVMLGTKPNPYPYLKQADVYVQTSIHEGYCITLAEAKVFELPIVSTDFAGSREQLHGKLDSYVVERNVDNLTNAIEKIFYIISRKR